MKLMRVKASRHLHWPESFTTKDGLHRGAPGYVVDLDAPFEREWCKGQEHKLEAAPVGAEVSEIAHPRALRELRELRQKAARSKSKPDGEKPAIGGSLPAVDQPVTKSKAQKV